MNKNKYKQGEKICEEIFKKTGDIRFHNMMNGFKELDKQNEMQIEQGAEREF